MIQGDFTHTSTKLRMKAIDIIKQAGRPLSTHEIECNLRNNDPYMWSEISSKCSDYVRIILSLTRGSIIVKFKSLKPLKGIDRRATFFGLSTELYPENEWIKQKETPKSKSEGLIKRIDNDVLSDKPIEHKTESESSDDQIRNASKLFEEVEDDNFFGWYNSPYNHSE